MAITIRNPSRPTMHTKNDKREKEFYDNTFVKNDKNIYQDAFPESLSNPELVGQVVAALAKHDYGETTLLATSLCCDEVNRDLERDFAEYYGDHFSMGGLAGVPFGGLTSFGAMAHHIPDDGSCLIVYGPHVGIDKDGNVGTVERRGRRKSGACCGSACAAAEYVACVHAGIQKVVPPTAGMDIEQHFVGQLLLPHAARLDKAKSPQKELPKLLFEENHKLINRIVEKACGEIAGNGKVALLGGIQINTPSGESDRFLPLNFELRDNKNNVIDKFEDVFSDDPEIEV